MKKEKGGRGKKSVRRLNRESRVESYHNVMVRNDFERPVEFNDLDLDPSDFEFRHDKVETVSDLMNIADQVELIEEIENDYGRIDVLMDDYFEFDGSETITPVLYEDSIY